MGEEREVGWGEKQGDQREGAAPGGSKGVARGTEGEAGWGAGTTQASSLNFLSQGQGRAGTRKTTG